MIRDRESKFTAALQRLFAGADIKTPEPRCGRARRANGIAERFIDTLRRNASTTS